MPNQSNVIAFDFEGVDRIRAGVSIMALGELTVALREGPDVGPDAERLNADGWKTRQGKETTCGLDRHCRVEF